MKFRLLASVLCVLPFSAAFAGNVVKDSLEMVKGVASTPAQLIRGKVSGVRVSSTDGNPVGIVNTNIRGINSVRGNNEPLWIVDGAVLGNSIGENLNAFWQGTYGEYGFMSKISQMDNWNMYDIESIEVLKSTSATALYGSRGANGVVIITTKLPGDEKFSIEWDSNIGLNLPSINSPAFHPTPSHNHSFSIGSSAGRTRYRLSAFFRDAKGVVDGSGSDFGGLRILFDTKANSTVHFGMNFALSVGTQDAQCGTVWYGAPSTMLAVRRIDPLDGRLNSVDGWLADYSDDTRVFRTTDSFYLNLNFTPSFRWKTSASVDCQTNNRYLWYDKGTAFGLENNGAAGISSASLFNLDMKSELQYEKFLAVKYHLYAGAGVESVIMMNNFNTMNGTDFFYKDIKARGFAFRESFDDPASFEKTHTSAGGFAVLSFDYDGIAGAGASIRADRDYEYDSVFTFYPSANAFLDFHKLFLNDCRCVSTLRIEGGYGKAGSGRYIPYEAFSNFTGGKYPYANDQSSAYFDGYNRLLTSEYDLSLKTGFLRDRITASLSWYNRSTEDNLVMYQSGKPSPSGLWLPLPMFTVAQQESVITNSGLELELGATVFSSKEFSWRLAGNAAFNTNRLVKVDQADKYGLKVNPDGVSASRNIEGQQVSALYGNILNSGFSVTGEGVIGNPVPKFHGGLQTDIRFRSFTFAAEADYAAGHDILNMNRMLIHGQVTPSNKFVEKGDFFRLSNLSCRYDVPVGNIKWLKSLAVSLSLTNLFTFSAYGGWNPDVNCFGYTNLCCGVDYGSYPVFRTCMLGIKACF